MFTAFVYCSFIISQQNGCDKQHAVAVSYISERNRICQYAALLVYHCFKIGSITARKYIFTASGVSFMPCDSHHPTVSTKDDEI